MFVKIVGLIIAVNFKLFVHSFSFVASKRERINEEREKTLYHGNAFGIAQTVYAVTCVFAYFRQKSFSAAKTMPRA